ncbi:MAG: amidohydrolase [Spirochaetales bacterium]|nr:amidohydrolase [Spirochaetales bacterium]
MNGYEMLANDIFTDEDKAFIIDCRRTLHRWPEGGFDLPRTVAFVESRLDLMGVDHSDSYGISSVVGYINYGLSTEGGHPYTVAIRADMDALPVTEKTGLAFASEREGYMHACGHDGHTAVLLGVARVLKRIENRLNCRVKLIFQASEESAFDKRSGAKLMCEDGVLDDVDVIVGCHVDNKYPCGVLGIHPGPCSSNSNPITVEFFGKSSHATHPEEGADALAMAVRFINDYQYLLTRHVAPDEVVASSICSLHTGNDSYNVIADYARIKMTLRTFSDETNDRIESHIRSLASSCAEQFGGSARVDAGINYPANYNDDAVCAMMHSAHSKVVGEENAIVAVLDITSEDYSYFARIRPSCYFRLGTRNEQRGCTQELHSNDFMIDEDALAIGCKAFVQFVLDCGNNTKNPD